MKNQKRIKEESIIRECVEGLKAEKFPPWKVEEEVATNHRIVPSDNHRIAALCRQRFIEEEIGEKFSYIGLSEKPYKTRYLCKKENLTWELDALDTHLVCSLCGTKLIPLGQYAPLVANYVGRV